jgi:acetyltransferase-like isoleucine patch superfamily enzyme
LIEKLVRQEDFQPSTSTGGNLSHSVGQIGVTDNMSKEGFISGLKNRVLQNIARTAPGATSLRVKLHRWRGVHIEEGVWIGYDAIIETSHPDYVTIKAGASIGIRAVIIAHFRELHGVVIEEDASIGPGAIIMPNVTIGKGSVVTAGSVVTKSVPAMTVVQGNPAVPIARVGVPLKMNISLREFSKKLRPLGKT